MLVLQHLKHSALNKREGLLGYLFSAPAVIFLALFVLLSILYCLYMSFFDWKLFDLGAEKTFVGLKNYACLFQDKVLHEVILNTAKIVVGCLLIETVLGFIIALVLWMLRKPLRIMQTILLLPMITAPVVVGLVWRYLYDPQFGMLNYVIQKVLGGTGAAWLGDASTALGSVMVVDIWQMTPFTILILYAAMLGICDDWIEAASMDGASFFMIVRKIIIPSVMPMLSFILLMRTMDLMKIFDTIYVLTKGGPGYSTETLAMYTYKVGFSQYNMGYAMALSIFTLLLVILVSSVYIQKQRRRS